MKIPSQLLTVARRLGPLRERVVFVGGMIRGLLATDPAAGPPRPTDDVDLIVDVPSSRAYFEFCEQLRERGFHEDTSEDAPICRWVGDNVRVDVMPIDPGILGFSNVWYQGASVSVTPTPDGDLRHLDGPYFCATKFESFASRAAGDLYHHDLEDFIALVDERESLVDEIASAPREVRDFLIETMASLLASEAFREALPGHLQGDAASQGRLPILVARLDRIARLQVPTPTTAPPPSSIFPPQPTGPLPPSATRGAPISGGMQGAKPLAGKHSFLRSSNLRSAEYDPATSALTIEFQNGGIYRYAGVPQRVYDGLLRAYSAGRYFHQWIRSYRSERLRGGAVSSGPRRSRKTRR